MVLARPMPSLGGTETILSCCSNNGRRLLMKWLSLWTRMFVAEGGGATPFKVKHKSNMQWVKARRNKSDFMLVAQSSVTHAGGFVFYSEKLSVNN